jgi:hypothetical protein
VYSLPNSGRLYQYTEDELELERATGQHIIDPLTPVNDSLGRLVYRTNGSVLVRKKTKTKQIETKFTFF